ncbi:MAG: ABC transporter substrate-binding protein [Anaerolineae bacterium]|nr:ABC transporter substrate-binding protein [Anaerolineae bacterium]
MSLPKPTKSTWRTSNGTGDDRRPPGLRVWGAALLALLAAFVLTRVPGTVGGVGAQSTKPVVKVGRVAPFEGLLRWEGYRLLWAVKLALQEANAQGAVPGRALMLVALDDTDDPARAARVARQMAADPAVVAVIGHFSADTTAAAWPAYQAAGMPLVALVAPPSGETLAGAPAYFLAPGPAAGVPTSGPPEASSVAADDEAEVWKVLSSSPGAGPQWLGPDLCHLTAARLLAGFPRAVGCGALAAPDAARWPDFAQAYRAFSGTWPTVRAGLAYDGAWAVVRALARAVQDGHAGSDLRSRFGSALASVSFPGVTGQVAFDGKGHRLGPPGEAWQLVPQVQPWGGERPQGYGVAGP